MTSVRTYSRINVWRRTSKILQAKRSKCTICIRFRHTWNTNNSVEDKDDEGNKIVRLSVKMDDNVANRATINDKGLFVSNITDCGAF